MDLPCAQWQNHVAQKWSRLDPELKTKFTSLLDIDDVFKFALSLTNQHDLDLVQSVSAGRSVKKDREEAAKYRERGNSCFKARDYETAALHYSQGICFAPQTSDQLSLCYSNRSAALLHLQLYQECLDDTDRAVNSGYPAHLSHKLQDRRTLCLNHLAGCEKTGKHDHNSSLQIGKGASVGSLRFGICPQASVAYSLGKGRHLVAQKRIAAGEVILTDRPYSCVLIPGMEEVQGKRGGEVMFGTEHRRCHRCLAKTLCLVPCEGCSYSRYCTAACQRAAWREHHRWECPLGADLIVMGVMAQLALRVTLKAGLENILTACQPIRDKHKKSEPCRDSDQSVLYTPSNSDPYLTVFHLLHHINNQSASLRFLCAVTIATLYLKLSKEVPFPGSSLSDGPNMEGCDAEWSSELLVMGSASLRHMLQLRCNAQAIITLQDTGAENSRVQSRHEMRLATAMFPTLSLLNHSCCPNTSLVFSTGAAADPCGSHESTDISEGLSEDEHEACGVTVMVRAARVINPGQEILHCYGPHSGRMATKERRRLLQEQYYFLCQCEACNVQEGQQQQDCTRGGRIESGLLCLKCKEALKKTCESKGGDFTCLQPTCGHCMFSAEVRQKLQEVRVALERAVELMETEMPDKALRLLKKTKSQSGLILGETHPLHGELADATARAYASMGDWKNAALHLEQSVVATGSQYGEDSIELGQQLFKLAQLHFNGGARGAALSVIPKVRQILSLHCGPDCPELQELKAMEECLQG
ncbi:SET and MYND domain-containing protein 4 isoform X2 [Kryptolebias marmoratus]|uniref:Protein-lysine N-methyltransferase SMYD4 n=1 Tax=Kryptolebias marmoratus TaxID=37003 RepID=A0A3Q3GYX0_KRYMA|nr:SET and MYND domain-containing protein 4 isoform X2 [Kryptolebias marmoratus]